MGNDLTDKQKRFCEEYVVDWNATQAAIRAGYSEKTAHSIGNENLRKPEIKIYIDLCRIETARLAGASALAMVRELLKIIKDKKTSTKDRIKAIEVVNKMLGFNEPDKLDHTTQGQPLKAVINFYNPNAGG